MSREEDAIRVTTRAIAATVREVPPLRLWPAQEALWSDGRGPRRPRRGGRRLRSWLAPVTAAAVIVLLAVALVLARNTPNGGTDTATANVTPTADSTAGGPSTAGPGGIPRYYVAIQRVFTKPTGKPPVMTTPLAAGDSLTGQQLATIAPPAGVRFLYVTAAGDDLTFVVAGQHGTGPSATIELFKVRLAPGTSRPARLTSLPIGPQPASDGKPALIDGTFPIALSASGTELAVAEFADAGEMALKVFAVATGDLLHEWTTTDPSLSLRGLSEWPVLTWIDGDRALTIATLGTPTRLGKNYVAWQTVRSLNIGGPVRGDLTADSTVLRHVQVGEATRCGSPVISADGKTFTCTTGAAFVTYLLGAGSAGTRPGLVDLSTGPNDIVSDVLWASTSGGTLIAEWGVINYGTVQSSGAGNGVQIDVISHGRATPLRFPQGFEPVFGGDIAW